MSERLPVEEALVQFDLASALRGDSRYGQQMDISQDGSPAPRCDLDEVIRERIRKRIGDRIHELVVEIDRDQVVLRGRCATYHTKQLAQHAALGVLQHEHLDNQIMVTSG